jgi:DMSO/TMAO reductase YedYZ molybdopterin-dependent catalytic subunit
VLSAGATPRIAQDEWRFAVNTESGVAHEWGWDDFRALGLEDITTDIHCVTHWSKLGMSWRGVPLEKVFENVETTYAT